MLYIWERIKKYDVISFDIFDTLVKRNVAHPKDIFDIVENTFNKNNDKKIKGFRNERIEAEKKARLKTVREEITLSEIYQNFTQYSDIHIKKLSEIEVSTEIKYCTPNYYILDLYKKCLESSKIVILTSDMYLPRNTIDEILSKCGICGYTKLFLSSEIGLQKGKGSLYKYILKDLKIKPSQMVHIGDGKVTDYLIPKRQGIYAIHIEREKVNTDVIDRKQIYSNSQIFPFINNNILKYYNKDYAFRLGYEVLGPLLLGFTEWIHSELKLNNVSNACFLARDMNLIMPIYSRLYPDTKIECKYLEVSRKSLRREYVRKKKDFLSVMDTLGRRRYKISELLETMDIPFSELKNNCLKISCSIKDDYIDKIQKDKYLYKKISEQVLRLLNRQDYISEYLKQFNLYSQENTAIIDIGWHGTLQNMLESITGNKYLGLYLGNTIRSNFETMKSEGYWFNNTNELESIYKMSIVGILEIALFPNIGTTTGYKMDRDGEIKPIYAECEASDFSVIYNFQEGALRFIDDYMEYRDEEAIINADDAMKAYIKFAFRPTLKQAKLFSNLMYEDGKTKKLAEVKGWRFYIKNPYMLVKDYKESKWKEGFIKQLFPFIGRPDKIDKIIKARNFK